MKVEITRRGDHYALIINEQGYHAVEIVSKLFWPFSSVEYRLERTKQKMRKEYEMWKRINEAKEALALTPDTAKARAAAVQHVVDAATVVVKNHTLQDADGANVLGPLDDALAALDAQK